MNDVLIKRRKTLKHYNIAGHAHFLTFSCSGKLPLLSKDRSCTWLFDALVRACEKHSFICLAYVIMPEHVHLLVEPEKEKYDMAELVKSIKLPVSMKARKWLSLNDRVWYDKLLKRDKGGKERFRFWMQSAGFDRNIFREKSVEKVVEYIHFNPVRRGLVELPQDWKWSSADQYYKK